MRSRIATATSQSALTFTKDAFSAADFVRVPWTTRAAPCRVFLTKIAPHSCETVCGFGYCLIRSKSQARLSPAGTVRGAVGLPGAKANLRRNASPGGPCSR